MFSEAAIFLFLEMDTMTFFKVSGNIAITGWFLGLCSTISR